MFGAVENGDQPRTLAARLPGQGREIAALSVEQVREQAARAPVLDPPFGAAMAEPDIKVAKLAESRGAVDERATVHRIHVASGDLQRGCPCFRIDLLAFLGYTVLT